MSSFPRRAALLALILAALAPPSAEATVTRSAVTSPADPTYRLYEPAIKAEPRLTVSGTTDGVVAEKIDLVCTEGPVVNAVALAVALGAGGHFSADVPLKAFRNRGCILRAVPIGYRGSKLQSFVGPLVAVTFFDANDFTVPVRGGGVATYDYYAMTGHRRGRAELRSVGSHGLKDQVGVYPEELGAFPTDTWTEAASLVSEPKDDESVIEVDGRTAYAAAGVPRFVFEDDERQQAPAGHDGLRATLTLDEQTGRVRVQETQRILRCDRWDRPMPRAEDCASVLDTGVRLERTVSFDDEHAVTEFSDRWISTDGGAHGVRAVYTHIADQKGQPRWRFPGEPGFSVRSADETVQPKAAGTVFVRGPEGGMAVGGLTFAPAPRQFAFDAENRVRELVEVAVPAGGVALVQRTFALAENLVTAQALARRTEDPLGAPAVSIAAPADGAMTGESAITVTGRATDNVAVTSVTFNGRAVALGADGSFSAAVALGSGPNRIAVVARDGAGLTGSASISVTRTAPIPTPQPQPHNGGVKRCTVPRVMRGTTVKAARTALKQAGCRVATKTTRKRSAKVRKGRVISLSRKAGDSAPADQAIVLTVSSGRKRR